MAKFPDKEMTTDTLFCTCSTTKAFTSAATSIAIQDSKDSSSPIGWDTPLASLIPDDFVLEDDYATKNTTLEDALSHRSGLAGHMWLFGSAPKDATLREAVRSMRYMPLASPPRTKFHYNNHMYMAVTHALEQYTGESLGRFLKRRIWDPLGMKGTYFSIEEAKTNPSSAHKIVQGYSWVPGPEGGTYLPEPELDYAPTTGAGAIVSNVLNYAHWVRELINQTGPLNGHDSLIQPRTLHFENGDVNLPPPYHAYALGWTVENYRGEHLYIHTGGWPGYGSMVGFVPSNGIGFVMMGNSVTARNASFKLSVHLLNKLLDLPEDAHYNEQIAACIAKQHEERNKILYPESIEKMKEQFFPSLPDPPIPHSLPLDKYTGAYRNEADASLIITLRESHLTADLRDRAIPIQLYLYHASGEFFVGKFQSPSYLEYFPVEFYIDSTGTVRKIGMLLEPALGDRKIWFERTDPRLVLGL